MSTAVTKRGAMVGYFRQINDRYPAYKGTVVKMERKANGPWVYVKVHGSLVRSHIWARPASLRTVLSVE